jgi:dolichol-phosphate mannosyltransferase
LINVLLPCFNEQQNIRELIGEISYACQDFDYRIIAVDDGSNNGTYSLLQTLSRTHPMVVLNHEHNMGLHEALKTLLLWVYDNVNGSDYVVTMDSDLTHNPKYIHYLVSACREKKASVAVASRFAEGGKQIGIPFHRALLSRGLQLLVQITLSIPVRDVSSGYRCIRAVDIKKIVEAYGSEGFVEAKGFDVQLELLFKLFLSGAKVTEIPFTLDYSKKGGKSKLKLLRTMFGYIQTLRKLRRLQRSVTRLEGY